jgi:hypothetical protein
VAVSFVRRIVRKPREDAHPWGEHWAKPTGRPSREQRKVAMDSRTSRAFFVAVVVVFVAFVAGAVVLILTALSQPDILHQILLIGMGGVLVGSGMVLLAVEVRAYAWERKHTAEHPTTEG